MNRPSPSEFVAALPPKHRDAFLASLSSEDKAKLLHCWPYWARPEQLPPTDANWRTWIYMGGRGAGKTRAGAEWVRDMARRGVKGIALVGETAADVRDTMIEGTSGIMAVCPDDERPIYEPTRRKLTFPNGVIARTYSASDPEQLRGPSQEVAWADELAKWHPNRAADVWSNLKLGTREGRKPRLMVTTTPRNVPLLREILEADGTVHTNGGTDRNRVNLAPDFVTDIYGDYEGTRLARQELHGELLVTVEGAMWDETMFRIVPDFDLSAIDQIVVAVDPSGAGQGDEDRADEIGIIVAGRIPSKPHPTFIILEDATSPGPAERWARATVNVYHRWQADKVICEKNYGGDMIRATLHNIDPNLPVVLTNASKAKHVRATPVALLYQQRRVAHYRHFELLQDQLCQMTDGGYVGKGSPDRADALCHAVNALIGRHQREVPVAIPSLLPKAIARVV